METRSRKRAEASSSSRQPATRSSKRSRTETASASNSSATTPSSSAPVTRSRRAALNRRSGKAVTRMDFTPPAESSARTRGAPARSGNSSSSTRDKGKEQQQEPKIDQIFGIDGSTAPCGADMDEENDDDAGAASMSVLHQNLTSASSALQGLLRKLGAGIDDLLPSPALSAAVAASSSQQSGRLKKILSGLRADGEEGKQVEALTQLCEMLSIGTEESLGLFSVDSFVPVLVGLLNHESNPDIMLLAARALTHLCDVLPSSCAAVVHYGAVPCFCARLLTIEYMDLAEQSLQALKKISQEHPTACLRAGALMAVLSYLDFFSTGVQRVALSTAANMCRKLPSDAADFVMEAVPLLTNLLNYHDAKVLEYASICLTRIAEAFASSPEKLDELCNHGLIAQAAALISISNSGGQAPLSTSTYTGLIRLLSTCASGSPLAAKTLLLQGVSGTLKDILSGSGLIASASVSPTLTRPPEQIYEIVSLADELLPSVPSGTISLPTYHSFLIRTSAKKSSATPTQQDKNNPTENEILAREKLLSDQPELLHKFGLDLLPILTQVYGASVNGPIRHKCLSVIGKLMYYSSSDMIQSLIGVTNISSFLAGILAWKDPQVLVPALQISEILMEKLPDVFSKMFVREGVVHAVEALICSGQSAEVPSSALVQEKDTDSGTSSRSKRYRRRSGALHSENGLVDELKDSAGASGLPTSAGTPSSASDSSSNATLRVTVSERARSFRDKYFPADPSLSDIGVTDDLLRLRSLCAKLNDSIDNLKTKSKGKSKASAAVTFDISPSMEEQLQGIITELLSELSKGDGVSIFEFIGSGVSLGLLNYLSCGTFGKGKVSEAKTTKLRAQATVRYKSFICAALPPNVDANETPLTILIQKLQSALSSLEWFPVVLSHSRPSTSGGSRLSSGLSALSQPLKLRLCRAPGEKSLRDYSSNIVLIEPMASLAAIEEFLWPRVQKNDSSQKTPVPAGNNSESGAASAGVCGSPPSGSTLTGRGPSTRSRPSAAITNTNKKDHSEGSTSTAKGKGKAILRSSSDESKGPKTRNANRRKGTSDKDVEMKPVRRDSSSEDEDLDACPIGIEDALMIDEDDVSEDGDDDPEVLREGSFPLCIPERVHDVKLGNAADDADITSSENDNQAQPSPGSSSRHISVGSFSESTELRSGSAFGSRGALSFAAAAMAGLASVSGRGIRGIRDRRGLPLGSTSGAQSNKLVFTIGGKQLSKNLTVYQAIQRQLVLDEDDEERYNGPDTPNDGGRFGGDVFTITYQKVANQVDITSPGASSTSAAKSSISKSASKSSSDSRGEHSSLLDGILQGELPCDLDKSNPTYNILALLRVLNGLNQLAPRLRVQAISDDFAVGKISSLDGLYKVGPRIPPEEFVNDKLTTKLGRQIQDVLALCSGSLPSWCYQMTKACPFLFPFETRRQFFYSTALGLSRALHRLQQQQGTDGHSSAGEREVRLGRLRRQKVRVSRNCILDSAVKVMEMFSSQKAVLEVEYFGEVGSGLGPTLEFYTLLSRDLQRTGLGLWRSNSADDSVMHIDDSGTNKHRGSGPESKKHDSSLPASLIHAPCGLFPRPWPSNADSSDGNKFSKVIEYFQLLGRVMAKALQDGRILDLPLSTSFYKLMLGQELDLYDILSFDAEFGRTLQEFQLIVSRKRFLESNSGDKGEAYSDLRFRGAPIEDLCLDFTLPGYPNYILKEASENSIVNIDNLEEYVSLVVDATVKMGITRQIEAFRFGFNQVFDITTLQIFLPEELDYLICGRRELWEPETLVDHIKFDHGYTAKSPAIINLLEIMAEFDLEQQRSFCQFVTGAPRLPPGGLAALNPKLTIVRKHSSSITNVSSGTGALESADDDLPSVMTCANYLKLPPYSTKEIMYKKLMYAIQEGQGSFDLS